MKRLPVRMSVVLASVLLLLLVSVQTAAAHSGEGVSFEHVIVEIGTWTLAVAGVIAVVIGVFWVRARTSHDE